MPAACKCLFIPLDIFRENQQNKSIGIGDRRDAWPALLAFDEPVRIIALIEKYPEFRKIYEEGYEICRNTERVMKKCRNIYSKVHAVEYVIIMLMYIWSS